MNKIKIQRKCIKPTTFVYKAYIIDGINSNSDIYYTSEEEAIHQLFLFQEKNINQFVTQKQIVEDYIKKNSKITNNNEDEKYILSEDI